METSRDSSIWRSLAVAFGDGLAFGVGMKLTQNPPRSAAEPPFQLGGQAGRLDEIEQRLKRIEQAPAGASGFDQRVLESIVNALEARLNEHAGQMERRLAELEARFAMELSSLRRDSESATRDRIDELRKHATEQSAAARQGIEQAIASLRREFAQQVALQVSARLEAVDQTLQANVSGIVQSQVEARMQQMKTRMQDEARHAAGSAIDRQTEPLRVELSGHTSMLEGLQERVIASERASADMLFAMGELCRKTAERITGATPPPPEAPATSAAEDRQSSEPTSVDFRADDPIASYEGLSEPPPAASGDLADPIDPVSDDALEPLPSELPGFAQPRKAVALWRVPLVSSFVAATGGLLMLRYLYM
ncbi:MAG TPA: hypothetical protein VG675_00825 [Bryobacteraceae bacterium]|nr:hypothetical protein [Bryobacteraceae bacterium]